MTSGLLYVAPNADSAQTQIDVYQTQKCTAELRGI